MRELFVLVSILSCCALGFGDTSKETCYQYSVTYDGDGSNSTHSSSDYDNLQLYSNNKNFAVSGVEMQTIRETGQIASLRFVYQVNATTSIPSVTHGRSDTFQDTVNATYSEESIYKYSSYWLEQNLNFTKLEFYESTSSNFVAGLQLTISNGTEITSSPLVSEMKAIYQNNGNQPESSQSSPIYGLNTSLSWQDEDPNIYLDRSVEILLDQSDAAPENFCFTISQPTTNSSSASIGAMILLILIAVISVIMIVGIVIIFVYLSRDRKKRLQTGTFEIEDDGVITIKISYEELKRRQDQARIRKAKKRGMKQINITKGKQTKDQQRQLSTILEESSYHGTSDDALTINMETRSEMSSFNYNERSELTGQLLIKTQLANSLKEQDNLAQSDHLTGNNEFITNKSRSSYSKQKSRKSTNDSVQYDDEESAPQL